MEVVRLEPRLEPKDSPRMTKSPLMERFCTLLAEIVLDGHHRLAEEKENAEDGVDLRASVSCEG